MRKCGSNKNELGFSLVELMIVVGIIGVLATLALPRFKQFQAKAKMAESKTMLGHIYTLQQAYALDNNTYITFTAVGASTGAATGGNICGTAAPENAQAIGFTIDCAVASPTPRYAYDVPAAVPTTFHARALTGAADNNRVCPGNAQHAVTISQAQQFGSGAGDAAGAPFTTEVGIGTICPD